MREEAWRKSEIARSRNGDYASFPDLGQSPIVPSFLKGGEKMAKRENVLEKLIGKTKRPEGELEAIDRRLHENTARCFDGVLRLVLDNTGE